MTSENLPYPKSPTPPGEAMSGLPEALRYIAKENNRDGAIPNGWVNNILSAAHRIEGLEAEVERLRSPNQRVCERMLTIYDEFCRLMDAYDAAEKDEYIDAAKGRLADFVRDHSIAISVALFHETITRTEGVASDMTSKELPLTPHSIKRRGRDERRAQF